MEAHLDFMSSALDEIALEGLDGITIPTLWVRLQSRPHFPLAIDDDSKSYLWKCLAVHEELEIFELPERRPTYVDFNRYNFIDEELGIVVEPDEVPPDIYPIHEVQDGDIRGSSATYHTRKCITSEVRRDGVLLVTLSEAVERWSEKLVLVASPTLRRLSLYGSEVNPLMEMAPDLYCLLERIGRSRYSGEVTQGTSGLLSLKSEYGKKMHYLRVKLTRRGLITKQLHYSRNKNGVTVKGSLFHLTRFYMVRKCKMESLVKCICEVLKNKPNHREVSRTLRMELDIREGTFKKLFYKPLQNWFEFRTLRFREMYPDAPEKDCVTCNGQDRIVKTVSLIRPYEEDEEEDNECEDDGESIVPENCYFDPYKIIFNKTFLNQAYDIIYNAGPEGITALEIREKMTLPKLQIRGLCKTLLKLKVVMTLMQDRGRQRVTRFISKNYEKESESFSKVKEQQQKFLGLSKRLPKLLQSTNSECDSSSMLNSDGTAHNINPCSVNDVKPQSTFQNIESEVIEVSKVQVSKSEPRVLPCFGEALKSCEPGTGSNRSISLRLLERANRIIDTMQSVKVCLVHELKNVIVDHEAKEGLTWKMDKKSNLRLLDRLVREEHLKYVRMILKLDGVVKELDFVCHPSISANDPLLKAAIEQAKFKYFGVSRSSQAKAEKAATGETAKEPKPPKKSDSLTDKNAKCSRMEFAPSVGRTVYGLQSKFVRSKYLHLFLFYLLRGYEGIREEHDEPFVYHDSVTWKRFVPPPPLCNRENAEGWCLLSDIMLCMPLSIFLKIVNIRYRIFGIQEYLDDPIKHNYLIKHLPQELRNALLCGGRYKWMIFEVVQRLCYMGLASFGKHQKKMKDKDKVDVYIHKHASIKDTTVSPPSYIFIDPTIEYEVKKYTFSVLEDVEAYWYDLENICLHTNLSRYSVAQGQNISVVDINHKEEMIKATKNFEKFEDVVDDGHVPGDSLGAAGLDSALFAHLKRNWYFASAQNQLLKEDRRIGCQAEKSALGKHLMKVLLQDDARASQLQSKRQRIARNSFLASVENRKKRKKPLAEEDVTKTAKRRKVDHSLLTSVKRHTKHIKVRTVRKKTTKIKRKPYYDDKDKAAMNKMCKQRVDWTPQEDSFLLLCKVASLFLNPKMKCLVVPFSIVRDLLHERFPDLSANKSSRACQRRVRYMLLNPVTRVNVSVFLGEARQDSKLVEEYDVPKPPKTQEKEWATMFSNVLKKLLAKFTSSSSSRCEKMNIPDTVSEFHEKYAVKSTSAVFVKQSCHQDPANLDEIHLGVITSIVLSSFATIGDKYNWSYTLYKLYKQYREELLLSVVNSLRSEQLITKKRDYARKMIPVGPMSSLPFRLSITYENSLITKYPGTMFDQAADFFNKLISDTKVTFDGNVCGGYCCTVLSLVSTDRLSIENTNRDQIIFLDVSSNNSDHQAVMKHLSSSEKDNLLPLSPEKVRSLLSVGKKSDQDSHKEEHLERPLKKIKFDESDDGICAENVHNAELLKKAEVSEVASTSAKPVKSISHTEPFASTKAASRIALYMLRQEYCLPPTEKAQHSQDYFVINSYPVYCKIKCENKIERPANCFAIISGKVIGAIDENHSQNQNMCIVTKYSTNLTSKIVNKVLALYTKYIPKDVFQKNKSALEELKHLYQDTSEEVLLDAQQIVDFVYQTAEIGVSHVQLWKQFQHLANDFSFFDHLALLKNESVIFRVGITCFRYVHADFVKPWVVFSFVIPRELKLCATECMKRVAATEACSSQDTQSDSIADEDMDTDVISSSKSFEQSADESGEIVHHTKHVCPEIHEDKVNDGDLSNAPDARGDRKAPNTPVCTLCDQVSVSDQIVKPMKEDSLEHVKFISRVWRKPDGTLNRAVLVKYLISILGHLLSFPGSPESNICERFSYVLQPVQTLELLEFLEKTECIYKYYVKKRAKATAFSALSDSFISVSPEPDHIIQYEPAIDAAIKMGKIKESIIKKH